MTEQKRVRIGFVGAGNMGQCAHLRNYVTIPECEVVAIAELRQDLARKVATRYGIPRTYPTHSEMLAHEQPDAIVASQPFMRHGLLIPELLRAGVPVFIEKPLAGSVQAGEAIVEAERAGGTFVMVGYHKRSDPATMYVKQEIEDLKQTGELGKLRYVRIVMPAGDWIARGFLDLITSEEDRPSLETEPAPSDMDEAARKQYLGFVNYYIHQVNLMRHLLGEPYSVKYADPAGILLVGASQGGVTCTIEMSPYSTSLDWQESAFIAFEHGWLRLDLPAPLATHRPGKVAVFKDPGKDVTPQTIIPQFPWVHAMWQQALHFVLAVKGEMAPVTTADEALGDLRIARDYVLMRKKAGC